MHYGKSWWASNTVLTVETYLFRNCLFSATNACCVSMANIYLGPTISIMPSNDHRQTAFISIGRVEIFPMCILSDVYALLYHFNEPIRLIYAKDMQHNQNKKAYRWRMVVFCLRVPVDCINVLETHFNCSGTIIPRQWRNSSECVQMHHMNRLRTYHKTSSNIRVQRVHISWDVLHLCLCT